MLFAFSYHPYIAIIGDIRNSKQITERKIIQQKFNLVLENINKKYKEDISSKFIITLGDEFQGLLCRGDNVLNIIDEIQREMHPISIRFGIGVGKITTDINVDMAIGADGPGYHKARKAIETLKQDETKNKMQPADIQIEIEKDNNSATMMLNTILSLMTVLKNNWTQRQREIIWNYEKYKVSQAECAEMMGIAQSSVHRSLVNGNYYAYKNARDTVQNVLKEIGVRNV